MKKIKIYPSIQLLELYYNYIDNPRMMAELIERFAKEGFYRSIEMGMVFNKKASDSIRKCSTDYDLRIAQWATVEMAREGLNLSSLNKNLRHKSVIRTKEFLDIAAQSGCSALGVLSGEDPGATYRNDSKKALAESLCILSLEASKYDILIMLEPLDREAHKKGLIGPTNEAISLIYDLEKNNCLIGLAWDSAHVALNGENLLMSLELSQPYLAQLHLSNAILDQGADGFGDHHIPFGEPGFLTEQMAAFIIKKLAQLDRVLSANVYVAIEMRVTNSKDSPIWEVASRAFLKKVLNNI